MCVDLIWLVRGMAELLGWSLIGLCGVGIWVKYAQDMLDR
jgi:hypothetical protein